MSPPDTWKLSDMNIAPQKGIQYAAGLYKDFSDQFIEITLEGYYKTIDDYLDYRSGARLTMNPNLEQALVGTRGRAYGAELMVRRTEGRLNGWASYTWSRTELRQDDPRIPLPTNGGNWYPADFDKPHEVKIVGNYRFTHRFSLSVNADYSTGRPITLPIAKYNHAGGEYLFYSNRNEYRVPDYFRVDASINIEPSHHLTLLTHSMISFGVYNLTGRQNAHSVYFKQEEGRVNGYKLSIFGAPIPYVSYNIKF
jgi:outer membrane receptor protein involved in Fe transport